MQPESYAYSARRLVATFASLSQLQRSGEYLHAKLQPHLPYHTVIAKETIHSLGYMN